MVFFLNHTECRRNNQVSRKKNQRTVYSEKDTVNSATALWGKPTTLLHITVPPGGLYQLLRSPHNSLQSPV